MEEDSIIQIQNLTKKFGDFTAVDNVSFEVRKGEIFAFLGPNGAGKTTTIKMLTTLLNPTSGNIQINGYDPLFPLNGLPKAISIIVKFNPLSYGVDGILYTLTGIGHFGIMVDFLVLGTITAVLLVIGSYLFSKIQI